MRNFKRILENVDTTEILRDIASHPEQWLADVSRQRVATAQRETQSIMIRDFHDNWTEAAELFPAARRYVEEFTRRRGARPGRTALVNLPARTRVYPHVDGDKVTTDAVYFRFRDRFHLVVKSEDGSRLVSGDEEVRMREGELWWFDNKKRHAAYNDSGSDRIHLIFDMKSPRTMLWWTGRMVVERLRSLFGRSTPGGTAGRTE